MTTTELISRGRTSFGRQAWADAYTELSAADRAGTLEPVDLMQLATSAALIGYDDEAADVWERAHQAARRMGDAPLAARCAFWLCMMLRNKGEFARAGGWIARGRRLLDESQQDCVEQGYMLLPAAMQSVAQGDPQTAAIAFEQAVEIGQSFDEIDLITLARLGRGLARVQLGAATDAVTSLDEMMVAVEARDVSPLVSGIVYCAVIGVCHQMFDLRRAQEWTAGLSRWCAAQPDLVPFRGECQVHRAEILKLHGAWPDAMDEAQRASDQSAKPATRPAIGPAFYQQGELHRLRGEFSKADAAYREASRWGRPPEPGLALLRLAQGQVGAAAATIGRALEEVHDHPSRCRLLPAYIEIMLAAGAVGLARTAADELAKIAVELPMPFLHAVSAHAMGAVLLAEGESRPALAALRAASTAWQELDAPYDAARTRVLVGLACRALGDADRAQMELDAAGLVFRRLGAAPDVAFVDALSHARPNWSAGGLTPREVEVLRLVASGKTNRAIAADLVLSEKTVARHVSNIFTKLGISSRSAATAYVYEHDLQARPT